MDTVRFLADSRSFATQLRTRQGNSIRTMSLYGTASCPKNDLPSDRPCHGSNMVMCLRQNNCSTFCNVNSYTIPQTCPGSVGYCCLKPQAHRRQFVQPLPQWQPHGLSNLPTQVRITQKGRDKTHRVIGPGRPEYSMQKSTFYRFTQKFEVMLMLLSLELLSAFSQLPYPQLSRIRQNTSVQTFFQTLSDL